MSTKVAGPEHDAAGAERLRAEIASLDWYHTLELAPGVRTPGWFDHRPIVSMVPIPATLEGVRCLDVGTFNGFWAFELERRGAREVVGVDVLDPHRWDWPSGSDAVTVEALAARMAGGRGFEIARRALGSRVQRLDMSVYELDPQSVGRFEFVYLGSLLVHLRDPVAALERVRSVCGGALVLVDAIDLPLSLRSPRSPVGRLDGRGRPWWWTPNLAGLVRLVEAAGFELTARPRVLFVPPGEGWAPPRWDLRLLRSPQGRHSLISAWRGDPHAAIVARPRGAAAGS